MRCRLKRKVAAYQAGALPAREQARMQEHLPTCACCQNEWQALERTVQLLRPMARDDAPRQVWVGVAQRLTPRPAWRRPVDAWQRQRFAPAFAAALVVVVVLVAVVGPLMHTGAVGPQTHDVVADLQVSADWNSALSDKAALGLAVLATSDRDPFPDIQEVVD
jgi:anti-sigma factor RsiW